MPQTDIRQNAGTPEPLLPIEKKLIGYSLGTGIVLLVALTLITRLVPF
jgi:hypothetical protein